MDYIFRVIIFLSGIYNPTACFPKDVDWRGQNIVSARPMRRPPFVKELLSNELMGAS
jgi:hypothetical protein